MYTKFGARDVLLFCVVVLVACPLLACNVVLCNRGWCGVCASGKVSEHAAEPDYAEGPGVQAAHFGFCSTLADCGLQFRLPANRAASECCYVS